MGINFFTFNGKSSLDYGTFISGEATWETPAKDIEIVEIPGRNGSLSISNNRFLNVEMKYKSFIIEDFDNNFSALKAYLMSQEGYQILTDTYHPDHFRRARYYTAISPTMSQLNRHGEFEIIFDCDPRRFLKSASELIQITSGTAFKNVTAFIAKPLLRVYGTGTITIDNISVTVSSANGYTDIDSEIEEAYKGSTNCNGNITLDNGKFPVLTSGINNITFSGFSSVYIKPNLWTI